MLGISKFLDILNGEYPFHLNFLPESPDFIIEWFTFAIPKFPTLPANVCSALFGWMQSILDGIIKTLVDHTFILP